LTVKEISEETGAAPFYVRHHYYSRLYKLCAHMSEADQASEVRVARKEMGDAKA